MNDLEYNQHAIEFFIKYCSKLSEKTPINLSYNSHIYVMNNSDFKKKDVVESNCLIGILERLGYLKYYNKINNERFMKITKKGIEFFKR